MRLTLCSLLLITSLVVLPTALIAQEADRPAPYTRVVQSDDFEGFGYAENSLILDWGRSLFEPVIFDGYQPYPQVVEDGLIIAPLKLGYATAQVWVPIQGSGPHRFSYEYALCDAEGQPVAWDTIRDPEFMLDYAIGWAAADPQALIPDDPNSVVSYGLGGMYWHVTHDVDMTVSQAGDFDNDFGLKEHDEGLALEHLEGWVPVSMQMRMQQGQTDYVLNGVEWTAQSEPIPDQENAYYAILFFWVETGDSWQNSPVTLRLRHLRVTSE